jgi:mannose-6-phosphate isomerase-like protein (cupin superfamily)
MTSVPAPTKDFSVTNRFRLDYNTHYDFENPANLAEIKKQDAFHEPGALLKMTPYQRGGGSVINSPWGSNQSKDCNDANANTVKDYLNQFGLTFDQLLNADSSFHTRAEPVEFCVKDLVVKPGNQLSLQHHQGREEFWIVKSGLLTVIVDGQRLDVPAGQAIFIPKGSTHCINNRTDEPVAVEELQLGICREEDNVRLLDATRDAQGNPAPRATYPITTELEHKSAILFAALATEIALQMGMKADPQFATFTAQPA